MAPAAPGKPMDSALLRKLEQFSELSDDDRCILLELTSARQRSYASHEDIVRDGERCVDIHVVLSGLACRYKVLDDGGRQILAFLLPGDLCGAEIFILKWMDHSIGALGPCLIASIAGDVAKE